MPAIHLMGGTIMGTGADNSVVNSFGQTHEVPNLYVAGPGIFPTCGASNPTYTIFSLSLRTAENISAPFQLLFPRGCQLEAESDLRWLIPTFRSVQDCLPRESHSRIPIRKTRMQR
jgi:choline dehydrogenase-like flavoprotein